MGGRLRDWASRVRRRVAGWSDDYARREDVARLAQRLDERLSNLEALYAAVPSASGFPSGDLAPLVSVIIPTRNRSAMLKDAVRSVQNQSMRNWEIVIVDDGSSDDTPTVIDEFTLADLRITRRRLEGLGAAKARNVGIAASRGELLAYLDDDNLWYPDFLAAAVEGFARHPEVDFGYGAMVSESPDHSISAIMWKAFDRDDLLRANFIDTSVIVHRKGLVERFGCWDEELGSLQDWDLALRYTAEKPPLRIPTLAVRYRTHATNRISNSPEEKRASELFRKKWQLD